MKETNATCTKKLAKKKQNHGTFSKRRGSSEDISPLRAFFTEITNTNESPALNYTHHQLKNTNLQRHLAIRTIGTNDMLVPQSIDQLCAISGRNTKWHKGELYLMNT